MTQVRRRPAQGEAILGIPRMSPMLAGVARAPFDSDDWLFEVKWDGYRCLAYIAAKGVYLDSRNGRPLLAQFPVLSSVRPALRAKEALLDGEIIALRGGRADFSELRTNPKSALFVAFDVLYMDGAILLDTPLDARKEALKGAMEWGGAAILSQSVDGQGKALFSWTKARHMEGVMAKRKDSLYRPGQRTGEWLKIKNLRQGTFWVVGYTPSPGRFLGSLVIAEKEAAEKEAAEKEAAETAGCLRIVGKVSSGLNREYEEALLERLKPWAGTGVAIPPPGLTNLPPRSELRDIRWVVPFYGVEVDYTEMTPDGHLRHPVFKEVIAVNAR